MGYVMLYEGDYLLVSCSADGSLQLHDVRRAEQPILKVCNAPLSLSSKGDIAFCTDRLNRRWRGQLDAIVTDEAPKANIKVTMHAEEEMVDRFAFGIGQEKQQKEHLKMILREQQDFVSSFSSR